MYSLLWGREFSLQMSLPGVIPFPNLRFGMLVGIGGGVPVKTDNGMIRLGDIVVSKPESGHSGAIQYDHGRPRLASSSAQVLLHHRQPCFSTLHKIWQQSELGCVRIPLMTILRGST